MGAALQDSSILQLRLVQHHRAVAGELLEAHGRGRVGPRRGRGRLLAGRDGRQRGLREAHDETVAGDAGDGPPALFVRDDGLWRRGFYPLRRRGRRRPVS